MIRVLIVDTDPVERNLLMQTLSDAGYDVLETANSIEAVQIANIIEGDIHLAVIAHTGAIDIPAIAAIRASMAILVISGPEAEIPSTSLPGTVNSGLLRKPFSPALLIDKVRSLLIG